MPRSLFGRIKKKTIAEEDILELKEEISTKDFEVEKKEEVVEKTTFSRKKRRGRPKKDTTEEELTEESANKVEKKKKAPRKSKKTKRVEKVSAEEIAAIVEVVAVVAEVVAPIVEVVVEKIEEKIEEKLEEIVVKESLVVNKRRNIMKKLLEIKNKNSIVKAIEEKKIVKKEVPKPVSVEKVMVTKMVEGTYIYPNKTYKIIVDLADETANVVSIDFVNDSNPSEILLKLQAFKQKKLLVICEQLNGRWIRKAKVDLKDTKIHITICPTKTIIPLRIMNTITLNIIRDNKARINLMRHTYSNFKMI